jgi:hypothetical protein
MTITRRGFPQRAAAAAVPQCGALDYPIRHGRIFASARNTKIEKSAKVVKFFGAKPE